ncbi:MAG: hypothetical protein ACKVOJ_03585 [Sphingomonadaceae bacterium]
MRRILLIPITLIAMTAMMPAAAAAPKCSFDENQLHSELIIYLDSGMACEADETQRQGQQDALTTYYAQLEKVIGASTPRAPTVGTAAVAPAPPKRDLDAVIAAQAAAKKVASPAATSARSSW